jgi:hypothetical protein
MFTLVDSTVKSVGTSFVQSASYQHRPHVDPVAVMTWDWVHSCLQEGTLTVEIQLLLQACQNHGLTKIVVRAALRDDGWEFPAANRVKCKALHRIFDPYRDVAGEPHKLKCSASELLSLYGLLRYLVAAKVERLPELAAQLASFDAACDAIDLILAAKRGEMSIPDAAAALQAGLRRHMELHIAAYGIAGVRPKHHWLQDVPAQLARDQMVLDTFVVERGHLKVKAVADGVDNTARFERSVLAGVLNASFDCSVDSRSSPHALHGATMVGDGTFSAKAMRVHGMSISVGDIVGFGRQLGRIESCLAVNGTLCVAAESLRPVGEHTLHWGCWSPGGDYELWIAASLQLCLAWKPADHGTVLVLR